MEGGHFRFRQRDNLLRVGVFVQSEKKERTLPGHDVMVSVAVIWARVSKVKGMSKVFDILKHCPVLCAGKIVTSKEKMSIVS